MNSKITTKVIVRAAILTAISIILSRFLSIFLTPNIKIGFSSIPLMIAGILFGPLLGGMSGLVADIIGVMINLSGTFHPGFTLSSILTGLLPGLVAKYFVKDKKSTNILLISSVILTFLVSHLLLNTFWLSQLTSTPFMAMFTLRLPKVIIETVINIIIMKLIFARIIPKL